MGTWNMRRNVYRSLTYGFFFNLVFCSVCFANAADINNDAAFLEHYAEEISTCVAQIISENFVANIHATLEASDPTVATEEIRVVSAPGVFSAQEAPLFDSVQSCIALIFNPERNYNDLENTTAKIFQILDEMFLSYAEIGQPLSTANPGFEVSTLGAPSYIPPSPQARRTRALETMLEAATRAHEAALTGSQVASRIGQTNGIVRYLQYLMKQRGTKLIDAEADAEIDGYLDNIDKANARIRSAWGARIELEGLKGGSN